MVATLLNNESIALKVKLKSGKAWKLRASRRESFPERLSRKQMPDRTGNALLGHKGHRGQGRVCVAVLDSVQLGPVSVALSQSIAAV